MAHQRKQVRSQILGLTMQVKPKFAQQKKLGLIGTSLIKIRAAQKGNREGTTQVPPWAGAVRFIQHGE